MADANENAPPTGTVPNGQAAEGAAAAGDAMEVDPKAPAEPEYKLETKTRVVKKEVAVSGHGLEMVQ